MLREAIFKRAFVPALLSLSVASWIWREQCERLLTARAIRIDYMTIVLLATLAGVALAERTYPANPEWNYRLLSEESRGWSRLGRDLLYVFVLTQFTALLIRATSAIVTPGVHRLGFGLGVARGIWPEHAPFAVQVALAFLLVELFSYWMHRATHRFSLLWRFHRTHHVISELSSLKALRVHPVDNVFGYVARTVPLMFLGVGVDEVLTVTYFGSTLSILAHANIRVSEGPLGLIVNFPRYHAVHHSADVAEANANFGCHTVLWDRVFGTFRSAPQGTLRIGVEPVGPRSLWREIIGPFYGSA